MEDEGESVDVNLRILLLLSFLKRCFIFCIGAAAAAAAAWSSFIVVYHQLVVTSDPNRRVGGSRGEGRRSRPPHGHGGFEVTNKRERKKLPITIHNPDPNNNNKRYIYTTIEGVKS